MKIGLVIYGSLDTISGGYLYDRKLVEYLRSQGDEVEIVSLPWRNYARNLADNFSAELYRRLESLAVDILLEDELNHPSLLRANARIRQEQNRFQIVAIVHHLRSSEQRPAWQNRFYAWIERRFLQTQDAFIFNSQNTANTVMSLMKGAPKGALLSVIAFPAGDRFNPTISSEEIAARQNQPGPLRLVFLGNLIERKGLHYLLKALAGLPVGSWELNAIGSPKSEPGYARRVQALAASLGLAHHVHFLGTLVDHDLAGQLRQSQLLVLPSSHEGYGIAYLEGMSFGLPAIAGNQGASAEIITHGQDGWLVNPANSRELQQAIAGLLEDRSLLAQFSLAARQRYLAQPTWEQTGSQIREFLLSML